jgi:acyl carrier protein
MDRAGTIRRLWRGALPEAPGRDDGEDFFEHGGDSLGAVELLFDVATECGVTVSLDAFFREPTLGRLLRAAAARDAVAAP